MDRGYTPLAKLARPRLHGPLRRDRLFALLDSTDRPVTWVAGPPGCGKTTLVASYLDVRAPPAFWYQVDGGDCDPATWFSYLADLAEHGARRKRVPLPYLTPEYLLDIPGFTRRFFREFFAYILYLCQSKVNDLYFSFFINKNVLWFYIPVDNSLTVCFI